MGNLKQILGVSVNLDITADSGSAEIAPDPKHPNKMLFKGILVRLDEPSSKPPNGAEGHKIIVSTAVAKKRLQTLIGMGINYAPDMTGHAQKHKVGVIEKAWIDGQNLCVSGTVWKHDFPEAQKDLKQEKLGMSMEIGEVHVDDVSANVWELSDFYFMGATILFKDAAAYQKTHLIAAKADEGNKSMAKTVTPAVKKAGESAIAKIAASQDNIVKLLVSLQGSVSEIATRVDNLEIAATGEVEAAEEVVPEMDTKDKVNADAEVNAGRKKQQSSQDSQDSQESDDDQDSDMDDDDMESATDTGNLEKLGSTLDQSSTDEDEPGHQNKDSKNMGDNTTLNDKIGKTVESARIKNLTQHVKRLQNELKASQAQVAKAAKRQTKIETQITAASNATERRSYSPEILGLLSKANLDAREINASGQKLSATEVDAVLAASGINLDPTKRMALKNEFYRSGLMDEGKIDRGIVAR